MNLKHLNDACLINETKRLARQEREILALILHHLREIERRRPFGKHSSLFAYAVAELKYSEDQAYRRIAAMRLIRELPELEPKLEAGQINLTHVGMAQSLFASEKKQGAKISIKKKLEVFEAIAGRTTRDAQRLITTFATQPIKALESVRRLRCAEWCGSVIRAPAPIAARSTPSRRITACPPRWAARIRSTISGCCADRVISARRSKN